MSKIRQLCQIDGDLICQFDRGGLRTCEVVALAIVETDQGRTKIVPLVEGHRGELHLATALQRDYSVFQNRRGEDEDEL